MEDPSMTDMKYASVLNKQKKDMNMIAKWISIIIWH